MFEDFYHLTQNPFQINTDPRFLWLGEKHKEALAILQYGVLGNKSFLLLTGDVGTGKTTLINALLKGQGDDTLIATIQDPDLSSLDLYNYIAYAFGLPDRFDTKGKFLVRFRKFLEENYYSGKKILLIIDEAQRTKQEILEDIRGLSNIEVDGNKLINIFFIGQNEFNDILLRDENKAIRQRITISYNIKPLTCDEVDKYIQFRLFKAGAKARIFKKEAVREIFKCTQGYPRLINILCDRCLLTGFVIGKKVIGKKTVRECYAEIDLSMPSKPARAEPQKYDHHDKFQPSESLSWQNIVLLACVSLLLLGSGWFFYEKVKNSFALSPHRGLSVEERGVTPPSSSASPSGDDTGRHGTNQAAANRLSRLTAGAKGQKERAVEEVVSPTSLFPVKGEMKGATESRGYAVKVKRDVSSLAHHERRMQIFFQPDSISPAPEYVDALKKFSDRFLGLDGGRIVIRGYTDRSGSARYNKKLAKFRADIVKTFLEGRGVDVSKITTIGVISGLSPAESQSSPSPRKVGRRVELEIVSSALTN